MHPHPYEILLWGHLFFFKTYSTALSVAMLVVVAGSLMLAVKRKFKLLSIGYLLFAMMFSMLAGSRLLFAVTHLSLYQGHWWKVFEYKSTGLSLFGGLILAVVVGVYLSKKLKLNYLKLGDTVMPFLGLGIAIMRVGCFLNGCCFGKVSNLP